MKRATTEISSIIDKNINSTRELSTDQQKSLLWVARQTLVRSEMHSISARLQQASTELAIERAERKRADTDLTRLGLIAQKTQNAVIVTDADGRIQWVNEGFTRITGYTLPEVSGRKPGSILQGPLTDPATVAGVRAAIRTQQPFESEIYNYSKHGRGYWLSLSITPIHNEAGQLQGFIAIEMDITERKRMEAALCQANTELEARVEARTHELSSSNERLQAELSERQRAEDALRESEERYALASRGANDGLWDWNLKTDEIYYSNRWKGMLGYEADEIGSSPDERSSRVHPDDAARVSSVVEAHLTGSTPHLETEHRVRHKDGSYRWVLERGVAVRDAAGIPVRMAGSQTDITTRKHAEEQLVHNAFHDVLVNLPNRALFIDHLKLAIKRAQRGLDRTFAVLFIDLDRFKIVNDSLGHVVGDSLLIKIARRLEASVRPGDTVARLGGDEFAILLEDIQGEHEAVCIAERIREELTLPFNLDGHEVFTMASIGIAFGGDNYTNPDELLRDADTAMYGAKSQGRGRYQVFDKNMHASIMETMQIETDLRRAIERDEFRLHYQPIVSIETGKLNGFEALVRWQHPERGLISPAKFVPIAEDTGLIVPIGLWVLREACRQMREWQHHFPSAQPLSISVNLSCKQFRQADLLDQIKQILQETGLDPHSLKLEITESVVMENHERAAEMLHQLRDLGIGLSVDDFGTGYSSLGYLHRFPISTLKVDRSFVDRMGKDGENTEIVRTIITLAHNLGMDVVAEGIETAEQLALLRKLNCEYGQGYLFSKPTDKDAASQLIKASQVCHQPVSDRRAAA